MYAEKYQCFDPNFEFLPFRSFFSRNEPIWSKKSQVEFRSHWALCGKLFFFRLLFSCIRVRNWRRISFVQLFPRDKSRVGWSNEAGLCKVPKGKGTRFYSWYAVQRTQNAMEFRASSLRWMRIGIMRTHPLQEWKQQQKLHFSNAKVTWSLFRSGCFGMLCVQNIMQWKLQGREDGCICTIYAYSRAVFSLIHLCYVLNALMAFNVIHFYKHVSACTIGYMDARVFPCFICSLCSGGWLNYARRLFQYLHKDSSNISEYTHTHDLFVRKSFYRTISSPL